MASGRFTKLIRQLAKENDRHDKVTGTIYADLASKLQYGAKHIAKRYRRRRTCDRSITLQNGTGEPTRHVPCWGIGCAWNREYFVTEKGVLYGQSRPGDDICHIVSSGFFAASAFTPENLDILANLIESFPDE